VRPAQGGPYREYDIMVWDAKESFTERMTIDSMFTVADRQTYQNNVEFNVGDSRITVCIDGLKGALLLVLNVWI
jgi:hypothetical protein